MKTYFLAIAMIASTLNTLHAQVTWFNKSSFGAQIDYVNAGVQPYEYAKDGTESIPNHHFSDVNRGFLIKGIYEYNLTNHFGFQTGLGFESRLCTDEEYRWIGQERVLKSQHIHIPVSILLRTGRYFWFETGAEIDIPIAMSYESFPWYPEMNMQTGINAFFGMRLRLYKQLSVGLGIRWGLRAYLHYQGYVDNTFYNDLNYYHRGINFSVRYQFTSIND